MKMHSLVAAAVCGTNSFTVNFSSATPPAPDQALGGVRYWANSPDGGPEDFGTKFVITFLFPTR